MLPDDENTRVPGTDTSLSDVGGVPRQVLLIIRVLSHSKSLEVRAGR